MRDIEVLRRLAQIAEENEKEDCQATLGGDREIAKQYAGELVQAVENMVARWLVQGEKNDFTNRGQRNGT